MGIVKTLYSRMPGPVRWFAKRAYCLLHPSVNWKLPAIEHKQELVTQSFVAEYFDDKAEFECYKREFNESQVPRVCKEKYDDIPDNSSIYDIHREESTRFYALLRKQRPETVVTTGVYNGVLTLSILAALRANNHGTLYTICSSGSDRSNQGEFYRRERRTPAEEGCTNVPTDMDPGWIVPDSLRDAWEHTSGESREELPALLNRVGTVDAFFHNSTLNTTDMCFEFTLAWDHLAPNGLLVSHHAGVNDACEVFSREHSCHDTPVYWRDSEHGPMESVAIQKPSA